MGKDQGRDRDKDRDKDGKRGGTERYKRRCNFCRDKVDFIDYKDHQLLRKALSDKSKLRSRRVTGTCRRHQSQLARAVKQAREIALLPYVVEG